MQKFIAEQNIQNFKASLAQETDPPRRAVLQRLLAEEEAKLAGQRAQSPPDSQTSS